MIDSIDHIVLTVRDPDKAAAFYTRVLGMEPITFGNGRRALRFGNQKINLQSLGQETRNHACIGSGAIRVECRIGGADLNPYLALAAQLAAGLDGIERQLPLEPVHAGDAYRAEGVREVPKTLGEAAELMRGSAMLRAAMGGEVI
ncbi:MAG: VOC family protein, partial [Paracoccaceae bacterium]|nr:VOC family protein [Paracoccaceae bacterium]